MHQAYNTYTAQFLRAFRQAPWRTQTQAVTAWSIVLLIVAVLGGLYLTVASRAGTAGRDLQASETLKAELILENNELRATLAQLRSVERLAERARALGFSPAAPDQVEYLAIPNYPVAAPAPIAAAEATAPAPTLGQWLLSTIQSIIVGPGAGY